MQYGDLVSIIVPVYNRAHMLARSVGCLTSQSYKNIEIIIVDDGSADDIEGTVGALDDSRINLIRREKNGGASAARNTGIEAAKGDLIAFHDSDDVCLFDKIEQQVRAFVDLPEDYVILHSCALRYAEVDEVHFDRMRLSIQPPPTAAQLSGELYMQTLIRNTIHLTTALLRRSAVLMIGGFDERLRNNEDWDFMLRLTQQGKVNFLPIPSYLIAMPMTHDRAGQHISRSLKFSAQSYVLITGKLRRSGESATSLAPHYYRVATFLLKLGRFGFARRYLWAVITARRHLLRCMLLLVLSYMPGPYSMLDTYVKRRRRVNKV